MPRAIAKTLAYADIFDYPLTAQQIHRYLVRCPAIPEEVDAEYVESVIDHLFVTQVAVVAVGLSLVGIVLWGSLMGSMLPLGLKRVGFDPATSSAPFVATLVDVTGLVIYFTVAYFILRGTLL